MFVGCKEYVNVCVVRRISSGFGLMAATNERLLYYVGHLESKERLRIQPAQLFNFGTHSTILHTVWTWHHRTFTSS